MSTHTHALIRMIEAHNASELPVNVTRITMRTFANGTLAIDGSLSEVTSALTAMLSRAVGLTADDVVDIELALSETKVTLAGMNRVVSFPHVARACGRCDRCLFGERCELVSKENV